MKEEQAPSFHNFCLDMVWRGFLFYAILLSCYIQLELDYEPIYAHFWKQNTDINASSA